MMAWLIRKAAMPNQDDNFNEAYIPTRIEHRFNWRLFSVSAVAAIAAIVVAVFGWVNTGGYGQEHLERLANVEPGPSKLIVQETPVDVSVEVTNESLAGLTLEQKVAQLFVVRPEDITGVGTVNAAGDTTHDAILRYPVAGLIYNDDNLQSSDQVRTMLYRTLEFGYEANGLPMFLAIEEEGGTVSHIGGRFDIPNAGDMRNIGATGDVKIAHDTAYSIGSYLADLGFNLNLAPVADIANNPETDFLRARTFGDSSDAVSPLVVAQVQGLRDAGLLCAPKHFPGIGAVYTDAEPMSLDKTLEEARLEELEPFAEAIRAGAPLIMVGHISWPDYTGSEEPASLSGAVVTDLLRGEMGYTGVVITDALTDTSLRDISSQDACIQAIQAGCDLLLCPADFPAAYQALLDAVNDGTISEERLDQSIERILAVKVKLQPASE